MFRFIASCVGALTCATMAYADVQECTVVDSKAVIGFRDVDTVSVAADADNKECRFSVNGVKAGSPPQEALTEALFFLLGNSGQPGALYTGQGISDDAVTALATLMLAAGPDTSPEALLDQIEDLDAAVDMSNCLDSAIRGQRDEILSSRFYCGVLAGTDAGNFEPIRTFRSPNSRFPRFEVAIKRDGLWNLVSFPVILPR